MRKSVEKSAIEPGPDRTVESDRNVFETPRFLTAHKLNNDAHERLDVVTSISAIAAYAAKMDKSLSSHVTIIWEHEEHTNLLDRDDQYGISGEIRPSCKFFRYYLEQNGKPCLCKDCDKYHYDLLKSKIEMKPFSAEKPRFLIKTYKDPQIQNDKKTGTIYLEQSTKLARIASRRKPAKAIIGENESKRIGDSLFQYVC